MRCAASTLRNSSPPHASRRARARAISDCTDDCSARRRCENWCARSPGQLSLTRLVLRFLGRQRQRPHPRWKNLGEALVNQMTSALPPVEESFVRVGRIRRSSQSQLILFLSFPPFARCRAPRHRYEGPQPSPFPPPKVTPATTQSQ